MRAIADPLDDMPDDPAENAALYAGCRMERDWEEVHQDKDEETKKRLIKERKKIAEQWKAKLPWIEGGVFKSLTDDVFRLLKRTTP